MEEIPSIRRVFQKHWTGCAIACIAMITGVSYETAAVRIFTKKTYEKIRNLPYDSTLRDFSIDQRTIVSTLRRQGFKVVLKRKFSYEKTPGILMCDNYDGTYHCVVWDPLFGGRIIDPAESMIRYNIRDYISSWKSTKTSAVLITGVQK